LEAFEFFAIVGYRCVESDGDDAIEVGIARFQTAPKPPMPSRSMSWNCPSFHAVMVSV